MSVFIFLIFSSCEREEFNEDSSAKKSKGFKILTYSDPNSRTVANNILSFASAEEFESTLDSLELVLSNYQTSFTRQYANMNDEDLNNLVNSQNIDMELPLTVFENRYNFVSLRQKINLLEEEWLGVAEPDFNQCPQVHSIISQPERALWNNNGEVMIAGVIYKYNQDDTKLTKINDGDFETLIRINSGDESAYSESNVDSELINQPQQNATNLNTICKNVSRQSVTYPHAYYYRVVCSNRLKKREWSGGKHVIGSGTVTYKKIGDFYQRFSTRISTTITGQRYVHCGSTPSNIFYQKETRASSVSIEFKRDNSFGARYNTQFCSIESVHSADFSSVNQSEPIFPSTYLRYVN